MRNVKITVSKDGKKASIEVDLTQDLGPSKSGNTILIATSGGNKPIPGTTDFIGLNIYRYAQPK